MTQISAAIYVISKGPKEPRCIQYAVARLSTAFDQVLVVRSDADADDLQGLFDDLGNITHLPFAGSNLTAMAGYQQAFALLRKSERPLGPILVTGSHVFGPIGEIDPRVLRPDDGGADVFACYWHDATLDKRLKKDSDLGLIPYLDFTAFSPALLQWPAFWEFWANFKPQADYWQDFQNGPVKLARLLGEAGYTIGYPMDTDSVETYDPRLFEVHRLIKSGAPCLPLAVLTLDPLLHDLNAIYLREALDHLRAHHSDLYGCVIRHVTRHMPLREFTTIADQYEVLPDLCPDPGKSSWDFGPVAVFIHAYYAEMMPEFWQLIDRIPGDRHLFITTATEDDAQDIRAYLDERGFGQETALVRVVEQNRGRDMSSLFITFRDVILDGPYQVALRLHSKRTPQVSRQVGNSFRDHLFDNLVHTPGYVRNILNLMEAQPDIGLVIPPVIHIGFGTLGHSWFNNKSALFDLAKRMGMDVPLDHVTPVAPYGTMYWFRTDALRRMFEWPWKWEDYNPEPHHIDGGLAHVQERLIGYCAQDAGYRVIQVMNPAMAARGYARLEYKLQMFASYLGSNNVVDQQIEMQNIKTSPRRRIYVVLRAAYGAVLRRFPAVRTYLLPLKSVAVSLLTPRR